MAGLITVTLPSLTNRVEDSITNQFALVGNATEMDTDFEQLRTAVANFYNGTGGGQTGSVAALLSPILSRAANAGVVRLYDITNDLDGDPHGSPINEGTFTLGAAAAGTPLPSEVAFVVTLEAEGRSGAAVETADGNDPDFARDRPKQRHTGRIYLGPLNSSATRVVNGVCRPTDPMTDNPRLAINTLNGAIETAIAGGGLGVWSRKDGIVRQVVSVSTDDSFDTQRRRGEKPTIRYRTNV